MVNFSIELLTEQNDCKNIENIFCICSKEDDINYIMPSFDEIKTYSNIFFAKADSKVIGFIWNCDDELNEVFGMVIPTYRKQGVFKKLLSAITSKLPEGTITFYGRPEYSLMGKCATELGYNTTRTELLMTYNKGYEEEWPDDVFEEDDCFCYYIKDDFIGRCSIYETPSTINIYDVYVFEKHQNKGYGKRIIKDILWNYCNSGKEIILQVTEDNQSAVRCYKSCGFTIKDAIIFYSK